MYTDTYETSDVLAGDACAWIATDTFIPPWRTAERRVMAVDYNAMYVNASGAVSRYSSAGGFDGDYKMTIEVRPQPRLIYIEVQGSSEFKCMNRFVNQVGFFPVASRRFVQCLLSKFNGQ